MSGVLQGGWEFVWTAYALSAFVLGSYAASVILRHRAELQRREREATPATGRTSCSVASCRRCRFCRSTL